jgi:two-component system, cell cycle response regulator
MSSQKKIYLLGFTAFEKSTFVSFFKLVSRRDTTYELVESAAEASVLMVNGDQPTAVAEAAASLTPAQKSLFIGAPDVTGRWPAAPRPIRLTTVLGLLDLLVLAEKPVTSLPPLRPPVQLGESTQAVPPPQSASHVASAVPTKPAVLPPSSKALTSVTVGSGVSAQRSNSSFGASNFLGIGDKPSAAAGAQQFDDILVVDDSDIALKFMQNRLTRYGFRAELVHSGEEAVSRVAKAAYKFVFLDVMMEGLDGYQTCRAIKQLKYPGGKPPVIVMLTSRGGSIDKIRGGLAGCDAYLTKPLNEAELLKVLSKYDDQVERSFRETNLGGSGLSSYKSN